MVIVSPVVALFIAPIGHVKLPHPTGEDVERHVVEDLREYPINVSSMGNTLAGNDPVLLVYCESYAIVAHTDLVFISVSLHAFHISYLKGIRERKLMKYNVFCPVLNVFGKRCEFLQECLCVINLPVHLLVLYSDYRHPLL